MASTRTTTLPESKYGWPVYSTPAGDTLLGYCIFQSQNGYLTDYLELSTDLGWSPALLAQLQQANAAPHNSGGTTTGADRFTYRHHNLGLRPLTYAASYGHGTGWCSVCGVVLKGENIAAGIHPVCAQRFGAAQ